MLPSTTVAERRRALPNLRRGAVWREIFRLIKYGLVGASNTLVSLAVLNLFFFFVAPATQVALVLGSTTAYMAGGLNSYWWNKSWTFGVAKGSRGHFSRFALLGLVGVAINAAVIWGLAGWLLGLFLPAWLVSNLPQVSQILSGTLGYLVLRLWVFNSPVI